MVRLALCLISSKAHLTLAHGSRARLVKRVAHCSCTHAAVLVAVVAAIAPPIVEASTKATLMRGSIATTSLAEASLVANFRADEQTTTAFLVGLARLEQFLAEVIPCLSLEVTVIELVIQSVFVLVLDVFVHELR